MDKPQNGAQNRALATAQNSNSEKVKLSDLPLPELVGT